MKTLKKCNNKIKERTLLCLCVCMCVCKTRKTRKKAIVFVVSKSVRVRVPHIVQLQHDLHVRKTKRTEEKKLNRLEIHSIEGTPRTMCSLFVIIMTVNLNLTHTHTHSFRVPLWDTQRLQRHEHLKIGNIFRKFLCFSL